MIRRSLALLTVVGVMIAGATAQAGVVLVEGGHILNPLVDSQNPLHGSQGQLDSACVFGAAGNIESIGVDPATGTLFVQLAHPATFFQSTTTCIFSVTPAGVVTLIDANTGFGINGRGTDLHFDPATGLLVTQDQNTTPLRIATIAPGSGVKGTYSLVTAPVFGGLATFGMGFSAGLGGSDVPAGDIVFTTDGAGNGIHSVTFGGVGTTTHALGGPALQPGDDLVLQPNGTWVHVGDFTRPITAFSPAVGHAASLSALNIQTMFTNAGLPFIHGSRATVCDITGDLYVSYSGAPGGSGIFRVDSTLTSATHLLSITGNDGLHDLTAGPSSSGSGNSVYFTVHDTGTAGEEIWEVTVPECACGAVPRTQGYWHRQCMGAGLILPGRNGRGPQEVLEPDFVSTLIPAVDQRLQSSLLGFDTCEDGLDANPQNEPCERALKQYTALLLNLESGRLQDGCDIDLSPEGCSATTVAASAEEIAALISSGDSASCKLAARCAAAVNEW
jgi:hypothetical protein